MTEMETRFEQVADRQVLRRHGSSYHNAPPYALTVGAVSARPAKNPLWPLLVAWKGARFRRAIRNNVANLLRGPTRA
jgi:hypothetical protein